MYSNRKEDSSQLLERDLLETRASTSLLCAEQEEEEETEARSVEEEEEQEVTTKKRSCSKSTQLKKKQSISNINNLTLVDSNLTIDVQIFESGEDEVILIDQEETEMAAAFNHNETWTRIKQLTVTSTHYTARDKNELIAQEPTFIALDDMIAFSATLNINAPAELAKKTRIDNMVNNAINQLNFYYFAGTEGWSTAIATIKTTESARLGLPEPTREIKPQIIHVHPKPSYQSYGYNKVFKREKNYGRHSYKKN